MSSKSSLLSHIIILYQSSNTHQQAKMTTVSLTPNAIRKMIMGEHNASLSSEDDPLIVMILLHQPYTKTTTTPNNNTTTMIVWDGTDHAHAVVMGPLAFVVQNHFLVNNNHNVTVTVSSFIYSEANCKDQEPFLCIIPSAIQSTGIVPSPLFGRSTIQLPSSKKIKGGVAPVFFQGMAHLLSNHALSGHCCSNINNNNHHTAVLSANAKIVADHLLKQSAMATLACSSSSISNSSALPVIIDVDNPTNNIATNNNSSSTSTTTEPNINTRYYMSALREFQESQMDRQSSSLTTNAGREDATRSALIVRQHNKALQEALRDVAEPLSTALLCKWHSILCGEGVLLSTTTNNNTNNASGDGAAATAAAATAAVAGVIRTKNVRVGNVHFRPHHVVRGDVDSMCQSINSLEKRLLHQSAAGRPVGAASALLQSRAGVEAATFAASVFFGVGDVHAFCDGNGRLARIVLNWALHKAGIPFVIHLFATSVQRKEYVDATVKTRRNLSLLGQGKHYSEQDLVHAYEAAGALGPLVDLILDRLAKTIGEFEKVVLTKSRLVSEEVEARAAKAVRDRERAGTCLICFDENPNIGTLCCGKAVHLNCVAQWLSQNNSCPNCREEFPALPPRMIAPPPAAAAVAALAPEALRGLFVDTDDTESTTGMEQDEAAAGNVDHSIFSDDDDTTTTQMDEDGDDAMNARIAAAISQHQQAQQAAQQQQAAAQAAQQDVTTEDDTTEDDTTVSHHEPAFAVAVAASNNNMNDDTESTTDTTTTIVAAPARDNSHLPPFCVINDCSNRAARDCANKTCGRCCISFGQYHCIRHNN